MDTRHITNKNERRAIKRILRSPIYTRATEARRAAEKNAADKARDAAEYAARLEVEQRSHESTKATLADRNSRLDAAAERIAALEKAA